MGNNKLIAKLRACARRASMYQITKDNWGNQVESYGGIPFVDMKTKPGTNDEVVKIGEDGTTSLYVGPSCDGRFMRYPLQVWRRSRPGFRIFLPLAQ